ncbi:MULTISPECIES: GNAT family N-acetyltransferase [Flavobacterium]|jgi:ribosomal protein S18 acetylase RimI-like enzyme|uniref:GNAT family acetyltransferase n=1 Tax=Flavobacterium hibernum TaxID=37752 RepID=A0A0D0EFT0_9FLAO|nr:GNAT family N-acetyltransferase [Flavobacterium hibernum]KIO54639.1 GNAT family acetyltransferase [Flavobacterium hibernum]OXA84710.1 N-acetyltransferase [Flavobacterium hibernum]STO18392.1 aminoalkylphosphonic acid N-acetyltransferase [Flavobacterium hibernum]
MSLKFRRAEAHDLPEIIRLLADDALGQNREDYQIPLPEAYLSAFENICADSSQELVAVTNKAGDLVGTMQLSYIQYLTYQGGVRAQIEAVRIRREDRGKGFGKLMFEWAIKRSKQKGAHVVQLTTDKKRPEALKFYESLGFMPTHEGMKLHI